MQSISDDRTPPTTQADDRGSSSSCSCSFMHATSSLSLARTPPDTQIASPRGSGAGLIPCTSSVSPIGSPRGSPHGSPRGSGVRGEYSMDRSELEDDSFDEESGCNVPRKRRSKSFDEVAVNVGYIRTGSFGGALDPEAQSLLNAHLSSGTDGSLGQTYGIDVGNVDGSIGEDTGEARHATNASMSSSTLGGAGGGTGGLGTLNTNNLLYVPTTCQRRVKSFDSQLHFTKSSPNMRARSYTKSFGNLVQHLAATSADQMDGNGGFAPTYRSSRGKKGASTPRIWSPQNEFPISSCLVNDIPLKYDFALILHNKPTTSRALASDGLDATAKQQMHVIQRCINAGLEVSVLCSTVHTRNYMCLLLRPTPSRLQIEKSRFVLERWLEIGAIGEVPSEIEQLIASSDFGMGEAIQEEPDEDRDESSDEDKNSQSNSSAGSTSTTSGAPGGGIRARKRRGSNPIVIGGGIASMTMNVDEDYKFTPADRIQTIGRIITSSSNVDVLNPPGAEIAIEEENRADPIIASCFPLHNRRVNDLLLAKHGLWWWKTDEITNELRHHYGEQVAFSFAFVFVYTKYLIAPALGGGLVYLMLRWVGAAAYMRAMAVYGICVVAIWGTVCLKAWTRQNTFLNDLWNLRLFKEAEYPNTHFKPQGFRDVVDAHGQLLFREPYYNSWYRIPAYLQTFIVYFVFLGTYVAGISFFVQWYTAAMMAPVCSECRECTGFLSCFNTAKPVLFSWRWTYIMAQGLLLGASLDIFVYLLSVKLIRFFVIRENHATEAQFEAAEIFRLFCINWISFFLWFILISFVIVPFGDQVETWLAENFHVKKLTVDWEKGVIDMSTALVTPLLITQALNLVVDTPLPYALRRETLKARKLARKMGAKPSESLLALSEYQSSFECPVDAEEPAGDGAHGSSSTAAQHHANGKVDAPQPASPTNLLHKISSTGSLTYSTKMDLQMMTPIRIPFIERELGIEINTLEGFDNGKTFMTADEVVEESQLTLYNPFTDYLRMVIQFGYVVMFSVVWPFCGMCAFVNNIIHIRNCFIKLFILRRRPVPRKANSIGPWEKCLFVTLILAVYVVVGLICLSSGELEYFLKHCASHDRVDEQDFSMNPDFNCLNISERFLAALLMEHVALIVVFVLMDSISDTPAAVRTSFQRKKELIRRAICGRGKAPASATGAFSAFEMNAYM